MKAKRNILLYFSFFAVTLIVFNACHERSYCAAYGDSSNLNRSYAFSSWSANGRYNNANGQITSYYYANETNEIDNSSKITSTVDSLILAKELTYSNLSNREIPDVASEYEKYNPFEENDWVVSLEEEKSTFSIDVDNASYTNFRRFVNSKKLPPKDAIRMEEWLNFFNYELKAPEQNDEHPLSIATEIGTCPWNKEDDLIMIKLQGKKPVENNLPPSNIVFLVDVSGSMNALNKLPLVQSSMLKLIEKLRPEDKMSIVTYAGASLLALEPTSGNEKNKIKDAVNGLTSGGGTAGSKGINTAYELAEQNFLPNGNNRIIVATDGDWNIGVTNDDALKSLIEKKRQTGIFLSVLGFGMRNLNDAMMESLADNGNGNYCYIDSEKEANRIFNTEFAGSMYVIAKDVKLQIEFDPTVVEKYRLIGYENRVLENWQFEDDSIDAGDLGMGQNVIAFYQVKRKKDATGSFGKIDFRYKPLKSNVSILLSHQLDSYNDEISSDFKYASCVVEFALSLRESEYRKNASMSNAILRGKQNLGNPNNQLSYEKRVEFVGLMETVIEMWKGYVFEEAPKVTKDIMPTLKLYPNPATIETVVEVPQDLSDDWDVQIFTISGALKKVLHFNNVEQGKINLSEFIPGVYLVKVYGGGFNFGYLRLVIE